MAKKITVELFFLLTVFGRCWAGACAAGIRPPDIQTKEDKVDVILEQLRQKTAKLKSYQAQIEYCFSQPVLESQTVRKGLIYYKRHNKKSKLRINFQTLKQDDSEKQKYIEQIIFDGVWLTRIDYQIKSLERRQLVEESRPSDAFDLANRYLPIIGFTKIEDLKKQFEIRFVKQAKEEYRDLIGLHLKVRPTSVYKNDYTTINFWIDKKDFLPVRIVATSTEDDIYEIVLLEPKVNKKLDDRIFEIEIPKGFGETVVPLGSEAK